MCRKLQLVGDLPPLPAPFLELGHFFFFLSWQSSVEAPQYETAIQLANNVQRRHLKIRRDLETNQATITYLGANINALTFLKEEVT